jgi:hypothetical protein
MGTSMLLLSSASEEYTCEHGNNKLAFLIL